jgi:hypothetical protein
VDIYWLLLGRWRNQEGGGLMGEGFIVRKGGAVTEQALAPTITEVSVDLTEIVFTITNNDASTAVILYEIGDVTPDENSIELAGAATSSNITVTGLTQGTEYTVSATASVTGKVLSNVTSLAIETEDVIYTAATGGTTLEYDDGGKRYKSHTFTSNGTFEVTTVGDSDGDRNQVDYLIIAGGGGGGFNRAGGGGAGGYRTTNGTSGRNSSARTKVTVTAQSYSITIGGGGTGGPNNDTQGTSGSASTALSVSTVGGGGGGSNNVRNGITGGSGGGACGSAGNKGNGTTDEGFDGGNGASSGATQSGGGGGGAGSVGGNGGTSAGGTAGTGLGNILRTGSSETRAVGGLGGDASAAVNSGTANTGNGGDGDQAGVGGGNGGSGIVVIRYEIAPTV